MARSPLPYAPADRIGSGSRIGSTSKLTLTRSSAAAVVARAAAARASLA